MRVVAVGGERVLPVLARVVVLTPGQGRGMCCTGAPVGQPFPSCATLHVGFETKPEMQLWLNIKLCLMTHYYCWC